MRHAKLSITLDKRVAAELRQTAGPRGVSAFVNEAVRRELQATRLRKLLDEMDQEYGPVPDDVQAEIEALDWPD